MRIQVAMLQGKDLPSNRTYLNNCSNVTAFKTAKYVRNIKTKKKGMQVNCNAGSIKNKPKRGGYGRVEAWYMPKGNLGNNYLMGTDQYPDTTEK